MGRADEVAERFRSSEWNAVLRRLNDTEEQVDLADIGLLLISGIDELAKTVLELAADIERGRESTRPLC